MGGPGSRYAFLLLVAFVGCMPAPPPSEARPIAIGVIVLDASDSSTPEGKCDEAAARTRDMLQRAGEMPLHLLVLATGGHESELEPAVLLPWTKFADERTRLYADDGADRRRSEWAGAVRAACRERIRIGDVSPIFRAASRGIESIKARCAERAAFGERCALRMLAIHSDLQETAERPIVDRLKRAKKRASRLPSLDVNGIELTLCGRSEHRVSRRNATRETPVAAVWGEVFARAIQIDAACPRLAAGSSR